MRIKLSDHFNYGHLLRFTMPSIIMMIFSSVYGVVDGFFVSNYAGKTAFAAVKPNSFTDFHTTAPFKVPRVSRPACIPRTKSVLFFLIFKCNILRQKMQHFFVKKLKNND